MESRIARRPLLAGLMLGAALPFAARAGDGHGQPLLVLISRGVWRPFLGSESPSFALYGDGSLIFASGQAYRAATLDPRTREALVQGADVPAEYAHFYRASEWTDGAIASLYAFGPGGPKITSVYGYLKSPEDRAKLPAPVLAAYDRVMGFAAPQSRPWLPERIELLLDPADNGTATPLAWPAGWPGLDDPRSRPRGAGYSVFLPSARQAELDALFARQQPGQRVLLGGRRWILAARYPFPGEEFWAEAPRG